MQISAWFLQPSLQAADTLAIQKQDRKWLPRSAMSYAGPSVRHQSAGASRNVTGQHVVPRTLCPPAAPSIRPLRRLKHGEEGGKWAPGRGRHQNKVRLTCTILPELTCPSGAISLAKHYVRFFSLHPCVFAYRVIYTAPGRFPSVFFRYFPSVERRNGASHLFDLLRWPHQALGPQHGNPRDRHHHKTNDLALRRRPTNGCAASITATSNQP